MRAPLSWIKEFVEIPAKISAEEISEALIRVGFEVEEMNDEYKVEWKDFWENDE